MSDISNLCDDVATAFRALGSLVTATGGGSSPSLSSTSGTQTAVTGTAKSVDLATITGDTIASVASVTPALPAGLSATITGSGTTLHLGGTATATETSTSHVIVLNKTGGGTLTYTLGLTVSATATPALSSTSGSQSATVGVAKSVDLATATDCTLASIASVTPALPAGLSASVGSSGTKLHLGGTGTAAAASASYVIVANVTGGGTLTYTLTLVVAASAGYVFNVNFEGVSSTATSLTDDAGAVWTPVGGATLNGVVPSGGGFQTTTAATLAAAILGTGAFTFEVEFQTTASDITLFDMGVSLGLPMGICQYGSSTPRADFYSTATGFLGSSTGPLGVNHASGSRVVYKYWRDASGTEGIYAGWSDMSWAETTNTTDYSAAPTKITLGTRQDDPTARPFIGTIYKASLKLSH